LVKARFWESHEQVAFDELQRKKLNLLLDGFDGKLTNAKCSTIATISPDPALREISDLVARGVLIQDGAGGRSTSYSLVSG
jgi:Fic family protein